MISYFWWTLLIHCERLPCLPGKLLLYAHLLFLSSLVTVQNWIVDPSTARDFTVSDIIFLVDSPNPLWAIALLARKAALVCSPSFPQLTAHSLRQSVQPQQSSQLSYTETASVHALSCYARLLELLLLLLSCQAKVIAKNCRKVLLQTHATFQLLGYLFFEPFILFFSLSNVGWAPRYGTYHRSLDL